MESSSKRKSEAIPIQVIETTDGNATYTSAKREKLWTVYWVKGDMMIPATGTVQLKSAKMTGVHGQIYKDGKVASTFRARTGTADKKTQILTLSDHVEIDSEDPKSHLTCDEVIYDGPKKIVKGKGHVQVLGTISTVGTLEELWTTSDFTQIASPKLFDQPMTRLIVPTLLLLGGLGPLETWTDGRGLTMTCKGIKAVVLRKTQRNVSMVGSVTVKSAPQGLNMTADTMNIHAVPDFKNPKSYVVEHATSTGHVVIVKEVSAPDGKQTTQIEGTQADYSSGITESTVKMAGPVTMASLDGRHSQTMHATGNSGVAYLEPLGKTSLEDGLHRAKMDGNVHMVLSQTDPATHKVSTIRTTSDHMVMENLAKGKGRKVTLTGSVHMTTDDGVDMTGINNTVFTVDASGNYTLDTSGDK